MEPHPRFGQLDDFGGLDSTTSPFNLSVGWNSTLSPAPDSSDSTCIRMQSSQTDLAELGGLGPQLPPEHAEVAAEQQQQLENIPLTKTDGLHDLHHGQNHDLVRAEPQNSRTDSATMPEILELQFRMQELAHEIAAPNFETWEKHVMSQSVIDSFTDLSERKKILEAKIASMQRILDKKELLRSQGQMSETCEPSKLQKRKTSELSQPQRHLRKKRPAVYHPTNRYNYIQFRALQPDEITLIPIPPQCQEKAISKRPYNTEKGIKLTPQHFISWCGLYLQQLAKNLTIGADAVAVMRGSLSGRMVQAKFRECHGGDSGEAHGCSRMIGIQNSSVFTMPQIIDAARNIWPELITDEALKFLMNTKLAAEYYGANLTLKEPVGAMRFASAAAKQHNDEYSETAEEGSSGGAYSGGGGESGRCGESPRCQRDRRAW